MATTSTPTQPGEGEVLVDGDLRWTCACAQFSVPPGRLELPHTV